mmetsp:Transcript_11935/g.17751  ORF Transcript_11935/g.17751 Transcript_11935/m.17751 type:complete len:729 (+) Transcript_11935:40-2226(+)
MKTTALVTLCLLLAALCLVTLVNAKSQYKVVREPRARGILTSIHDAAELGECKRSQSETNHVLRGQKKLNEKNDREIEMIKKLLQMMKVGVHSRHAEKSSLVRLLTRLLNRLLRIRADNLDKIRPLQRRFNTLKEECARLKKEHELRGRAVRGVTKAVNNQINLVSGLKKTDSRKRKCEGNLKSTTKAYNKKAAALKNMIKKHDQAVAAREKCKKNLHHKKNAVASQRATNTKLKKDIVDINKNHGSCSSALNKQKSSNTECQGDYEQCKDKKKSLNSDLDSLQQLGHQCNKKLSACQTRRLEHMAKCTKTTNKASGLERQYGNCENSLEHCEAKLATNSEALPKCNNDVRKVADELAKISKKRDDVRKELETYKPKIKQPKPLPIGSLKPKYPAPSKTKRTCYSTGDPHYGNLAGQRFDIYGRTGYYVLARIPGEFEVETNIQYGRPWRNRGLNVYVGVRLGQNVIYGRYGSYVLNGKTLSLGVGRTLKLKGGHAIRRTSSTHFMFLHASGSYVTVAGARSRGYYYHNIYVGVPTNWVPYVQGFCKSQSRNVAVSGSFINSVAIRNANDERHLIGKKFVAPVIPKSSPFHHIPWKSTSLKASAEKYCGSTLKLKGSQYVNCLMDAKVFGSISGATTYKGVTADLKDAAHLENVSEKSAPGHMLRELSRARLLLEASAKNFKTLEKSLKHFKDQTLAKDISNLGNRLAHETKFIRGMSADFTREVFKL